MSQSLAILGTGSDVGKSLIAAGLCRLLRRAGVRVAPFKAQNMSLNSFVTQNGGEMGRAQVLQAQACELTPHVDMNPILLKPEAEHKSQVIVQGKVWESQKATEYFQNKHALFEVVKTSYERLAKAYEFIVIEGAGSAAELNLRDRDIVNWPVVEMANAHVVLVADIDRGGVFAQIIGTFDLLREDERQRVIGIVINKFRGDLTLFEDGVRIIEERTGVTVLGVLPFLRNLDLDQEDSVELERFRCTPFFAETVNVAVILVPHMSNFTDFNQLGGESDVALRYVKTPQELHGADVVVLPGSKTTITDLEYLQTSGFGEALARHLNGNGEIVGICGGFQMLGLEVSDPHGVETGGTIGGFGMLGVTTELHSHKNTMQVNAQPLNIKAPPDCWVDGYEIHMGVTRRISAEPCFRVFYTCEDPSLPLPSPIEKVRDEEMLDGAIRDDGLVWGTYIHGVFDRPGFRRAWLNRIRQRKGLMPLDRAVSEAVSTRYMRALDRWADHVQGHIEVGKLFDILGIRAKS